MHDLEFDEEGLLRFGARLFGVPPREVFARYVFASLPTDTSAPVPVEIDYRGYPFAR